MVTRRCILAKLSEVTADRYRELIEQGAGALVILLPESLTSSPQDVLNVSSFVEIQSLHYYYSSFFFSPKRHVVCEEVDVVLFCLK